jgi:hypothetical protein
MARKKKATNVGQVARERLGAWRGFSPGEYGVNLQYGVMNPPPSGNLGPSAVMGMPLSNPQLNQPRFNTRQPPGYRTGGVPGRPIDPAAGNPDVSTDPINVPKRPYGGGPNNEAASQFGIPRPLQDGWQESTWRGGAFFANDKLITRDRHAYLARGNEISGRNSGFTDPPMDGPARPSLRIVQRSISYQQGTDNDAAQDDLSRPYTRNAQGMYMGTQGDSWSPVYGGTPGLWQPYGTYQGYGNVPIQGIQAPVEQGTPGDGPQSFQPGPPHGLHSPTLPDYAQTLGYYMAVPQMRAPRIDRPSNSPIGGQSYSQTVTPQGQTGTIAQGVRGNAGVNWQTRKVTGWRGQPGGGQDR